jgi:hypothetical protein
VEHCAESAGVVCLICEPYQIPRTGAGESERVLLDLTG